MIGWPQPASLTNGVAGVRFEDDRLIVDLQDGRTIAVPVDWYPRLADATSEQCANWEASGAGYGIHWPDVDEDLSTIGLLRGYRHRGGERPERSMERIAAESALDPQT